MNPYRDSALGSDSVKKEIDACNQSSHWITEFIVTQITCQDSEASEPIETNARPAKTRCQNMGEMGECGDHDWKTLMRQHLCNCGLTGSRPSKNKKTFAPPCSRSRILKFSFLRITLFSVHSVKMGFQMWETDWKARNVAKEGRGLQKDIER
jgi:hypothetical protein